MRKSLKISFAIFLVMLVSAAAYFSLQSGGEKGIEATVSKVIDGDTIELANGDKVRLVGIDAPEKTQPYHKDVLEKLKVLEGKTVRMEKDKTNKDRYGRYLRYVHLGDHFVNLELLQNGLVYAYIVSPDKKYEKEFLEAEAVARANGVGIWKRSLYSDCISVKSFHYNARGDDNQNLEDEFFVVKNSCTETIDARGWVVRNTYNSFPVPDFGIESGGEMKIVTGKGTNGPNDVFLSLERPIWNNAGDTLYLRDVDGSIIASDSYSNG